LQQLHAGLGRPVVEAPSPDTQWHTHTLYRTPLGEGSARRRDLYLAAHNIYKRQTFVPSAGFQPAIPASERPQTRALERAATGIGV